MAALGLRAGALEFVADPWRAGGVHLRGPSHSPVTSGAIGWPIALFHSPHCPDYPARRPALPGLQRSRWDTLLTPGVPGRGGVATSAAVVGAEEVSTPAEGVVSAAEPGVLPHSIVLDQGPREEMEDEAVVRLAAPSGYTYAAVLDGHEGSSSSTFLKEELFKACMKAIKGGEALQTEQSAVSALTEAFQQTDKALLDCKFFHLCNYLANQKRLLETPGVDRTSGSTATVVLVRAGEAVVVAHAGDSRAVLCRGGDAVDLCGDHRPYGASKTASRENKRIRQAGGWVINGRVCGMLAVSRAFGDVMYKQGRQEMLDEGIKRKRWTQKFVSRLKLDDEWVTATPDVSFTPLQPEDKFIIVASDGLWDVVKSSAAVKFVQKQLSDHGSLQKAAEELVTYAIRDKVGQDNTTVVVIGLQ